MTHRGRLQHIVVLDPQARGQEVVDAVFDVLLAPLARELIYPRRGTRVEPDDSMHEVEVAQGDMTLALNEIANFWFEDLESHHIERMGVTSLLYETDFPHPTCLYPDPLEAGRNGSGEDAGVPDVADLEARD